ncbi:type IV pilin [Enterovibrio norvegicus]|uniref:hypothetical protein n=1 Tax=Enterovibrio norvegicus TaxID=188144 RepID=UPI000377AB41|nr:hypothetical protein [Enterovibrio norvegicus]OEE43572.1 hypothetical protein A1OS_10725 [Enterovibrio norvegicus]
MIFKGKGFSLIDVLIGLVLLVVGSIGFVKAQVFVGINAENALIRLPALNLAEEKLESFRTRSQSLGTGTSDFDSIASSEELIAIEGVEVLLKINVEKDTPIVDVKKVSVTASWNDRRGDAHSIVLATLISRFSEFDES